MAIASMVLGIISICIALPKSIILFPVGFLAFVLAVLGLVFGIVSLKTEGSNTKAIAGVVTSASTLFLNLCSIAFYAILLFWS